MVKRNRRLVIIIAALSITWFACGEKATKFALNNIKVPIGAVGKPIMCCSILGLVKMPSEYGEWAAKTALEILDGKAPSDIPLTQNKEGEIILNLDLAEKLDIAFDVNILKKAQTYQGSE